MTINGQCGLIHMQPAAPRTWLIQCPPGMLAQGHVIKRFTSVEAFEGYVRQVRAMGLTVRFDSPFAAVVEALA